MAGIRRLTALPGWERGQVATHTGSLRQAKALGPLLLRGGLLGCQGFDGANARGCFGEAT
jgi:hypothetical protein